MVRFFPSTSATSVTAGSIVAPGEQQQQQQSQHSHAHDHAHSPSQSRRRGFSFFFGSRANRRPSQPRADTELSSHRFLRQLERQGIQPPSQELLDLLQALANNASNYNYINSNNNNNNNNSVGIKQPVRASDRAIQELMHFRLRNWKPATSSSSESSSPPLQCHPCSDGTSCTVDNDTDTDNDDFLKDDLDVPSCVICSEAFVEGSVVSRIPCGHVYHADCLLRWLYRGHSCPTCRYELATDNASFEIGRKERMKHREPKIIPSWENWSTLASSWNGSGCSRHQEGQADSLTETTGDGSHQHSTPASPSFKFVEGIDELSVDNLDCLSLQIVHDGRRTIGYWHMDKKKQQQLLLSSSLGKTSPKTSPTGSSDTKKTQQHRSDLPEMTLTPPLSEVEEDESDEDESDEEERTASC